MFLASDLHVTKTLKKH